MLTIAQIAAPADVDAARELVREFTSWALTLVPDAQDAPTFANLEEELATLPGKFGPPEGRFLLARHDGSPAGCVAFRAHGVGVVELKRMYVRQDQRGRGVGRELVRLLVAEARALGLRRIVLDSYHTMTGAHRIYRAAGFRDVAAPPGFPEQYRSRVVFMELDLG